jgi:cobalt/nickel transport system permease protein
VVSAEPRRSQVILAGWMAGIFAVSALTEPSHLALAGAVAWVLLSDGALRAARRTLLAVVPLSGGLALASLAWLRLRDGAWPDGWPYAALVLRTAVIAFTTFSVLARVELLRALAPFPTATRLLVLTLAQIHALRLVAIESFQGLRSRLLRQPAALDVVRGAGGITAALFTLSMRNARDISDAMRSRGF